MTLAGGETAQLPISTRRQYDPAGTIVGVEEDDALHGDRVAW
jgi:phosphoribosylaminoimidazole (AIR) synthetase